MLYINKKDAEELVEHAKREAPNEACGILAGNDGKVNRVYLMTNTDKSSQSFFMDPKEQIRVMKDIRKSQLEIVGIYHSHPETEAFPSEHDVSLAFYEDTSYVIISLKEGENIRSFKIKDKKISEEELIVQ